MAEVPPTVTGPAPDAAATGGALPVLADLMAAYAHRRPVHRVGVVGNAPMAPDEHRAAALDGCDLVLRMNSFVLDRPGDPPVQGSRVDVVVWNRLTMATRHLFEHYRERLYLLVEPMRLHGNPEMWPASWPRDLGYAVVPNGDVGRAINEELGYDWEGERLAPTTGLTAAWLGVTLFGDAEVLLTGFSFLGDPGQQAWTYQSGATGPVGREHRLDAEARLMRSWIEDGRAEFLPMGEGENGA